VPHHELSRSHYMLY